MGEKAAAAGVAFGYHNHTREFVVTEGKTPYMELLRLTDPKKVTFELDCGWAVVAGEESGGDDARSSVPHLDAAREGLQASGRTPSPEGQRAAR